MEEQTVYVKQHINEPLNKIQITQNPRYGQNGSTTATFPFITSDKVPTLEYLITVQHLLNVYNGKFDFIWLAKKDNLKLLNLWRITNFKAFGINVNAQHVNGMTPLRLLDTVPVLISS